MQDLEEECVCSSFIMGLCHVVSRAKEEAWGVGEQHLDAAPWQRTCSHIALCTWRFGEARDNCHPQLPNSQDLAPADFFLAPKVEIYSEMWPISDNRRDTKKFTMRRTRYPTKHVPGCVTELGIMLEALYWRWKGAVWRRQVLLSCKIINKHFKKKVCFLFGQTTYISIH
jgi:hypothetical protein